MYRGYIQKPSAYDWNGFDFTFRYRETPETVREAKYHLTKMKPFIRTAAKRTLIDTEESVGLRNQQVKKLKQVIGWKKSSYNETIQKFKNITRENKVYQQRRLPATIAIRGSDEP